MALTPVPEAQDRILAGVEPLEAEQVAIGEAEGRVLAGDLVSLRTQPPFDASAMDGYAVRGADLGEGARLVVVGESAAGRRYAGTLSAGEAVRIFTGAPVPDGADTVVLQETVVRDGDVITLSGTERPGRHIRGGGLDFAAGSVGLRGGTRLGPREIGLAAAMNHGVLSVSRRPRVAILATGDELVPPGGAVGDDQIVASNGLTLAAMVRAAGGTAIDLGIAPDRMEIIRERIRAGLDQGADVLCLLGGASVGDRDLSRPALEAEGLSLDFWKLAMRPGKPLMFGRIGERRAIGIPGNPVSSFVCGLLFVQPLVRALAGERNVLPEEEQARLGRALPANDQRQDYLRSTLGRDGDGALVATPLPVQDSSMLSALAAADALVIRPPFAPPAAEGDVVRIIRL